MNLQTAAEDVLKRIENDGSNVSLKLKREAAIHATLAEMQRAKEISTSEWGEQKRLLSLKVSELEKLKREKISEPAFSEKELAGMISDPEETRETESSGRILHGLYPESSTDPEGTPKIKKRWFR